MIVKSRMLAVWAFILALFFLPAPYQASCFDSALAPTEPSSSAPQPGIVSVTGDRTKLEIVAMAKALPHSGFTYSKTTAYSQSPSLKSPYAAGSLSEADITDALNALKMVRYLAGLPYENVSFDAALNEISQHGAVLLAATKQFTHTPDKPGDMDDGFYSLAYKGCSQANLYKGHVNISAAVLGFIADPGDINIGEAGHRRWLLKPGGESFGIGYAEKLTSLYVYGGKSSQPDTYVAWPNSGDFPIEYFVNSNDTGVVPAFTWSINLGAAYGVPSRESVTLTLTRARDGKTWVFDRNTPQLGAGNMPSDSMHFAVDNIEYGMGKAILFRPDLTSLGQILEGDEFTVQIDGLSSAAGVPTRLCYTISFFSLQTALEEEDSISETHTQNELVKNTAVSGKGVSFVPYCMDGNGLPSPVKMSADIDGAIVFIAPRTASYYYKSNAKSFSDTVRHWADEHIAFVSSREIFSGVGGGLFDPDGTMTRAMFVTVLARLSGADENMFKGSCTFSDVKSGQWYEWAVAWAERNGITTGVGNNQFQPDLPVSREQMASLIIRCSDTLGYALTVAGNDEEFADDASISDWGRAAVYELRQAGIISGKPGNLYDPRGNLTRAEASVMLRNFIENVLAQ